MTSLQEVAEAKATGDIALATGETATVLSAIRTYRGTSPQMVGFGTLILEALPPDRAGPDEGAVRRRPSPPPYRSP